MSPVPLSVLAVLKSKLNLSGLLKNAITGKGIAAVALRRLS
jgi:hypothetical protein